jgi:isoleucyl-tRNA synthetase
MFQKVDDANFIAGEHEVLRFWREADVFRRLQMQNRGKQRWSFLDGPITANNPMGVHHAWGRTYKDAYQRYFAMTGHDQRYQNGFDCQGLWVEVEVEKELKLGTKKAIAEYGIDRFVQACKKRVLRFAARQTEQSIRLGYWMEWDDPDELRKLAEAIGGESREQRAESRDVESPLTTHHSPLTTYRTARGHTVTAPAEEIAARLGCPEWGGSYFTFSTENNETIWTFLKKCFDRKKVYQGHDVMPWSGRGGSAYSQMEVADGRRLTTHRSCFVRFPIVNKPASGGRESADSTSNPANTLIQGADAPRSPDEYLLVWTTTPWTLTSNVAAAVNPDLEYVKLRAKKDGAVYYFAKENLEYQRLGREFKEGFGRPEWSWPEGVPKLKTIAQLFKEQGGYEVEGTLKGAEMVGWRYAGPFDDLPAQQKPGGYPEEKSLLDKSGVMCHRVIDGGRDSKGSPNVTAGEGTGIVHIAPGCGDVDHVIGKQLGLVGIAPLQEDGTFGDGFGPFSGKEAINPAVAELVFEELKKKGLLVYVETYPHIYPHCWRTGDELVFRLVDEWFINMDWRDEIKDVTRQIRWLPDSIDGQEREIEWLTNMRDWMISKKRFWGLALPIWVNPDDPSDFEVIGSLAELRERAREVDDVVGTLRVPSDQASTMSASTAPDGTRSVPATTRSGWAQFDGHTPHRPWIDQVKIRSKKTGALLSRIEDVGNPWLDAGIVPFSTMHYNHDRAEWEKWYPADFVTECFPGQFRNWFYSLLSLSTMMRYDETGDPAQKRPFKTLLGHRLVMNEEGKPMHKSDGTAIWFEEAAEQLGVDTIRWMYCAQNPAADLRFGTRHPDESVTLPTMDGPISSTKEGLPCCKVTSKPADEVRRLVLLPLWNSYAFFVNYARLDEFDPALPQVPVDQRPEIDQWILSNLQAFLATANEHFREFDVAEVCQAAAAFIDDLSNWYIRINRGRFWRSKDASDTDKLAAYQTLYAVLVTFTKALAPIVPFLAERMYQNLVSGPLSAVSRTGADTGVRAATSHGRRTTDHPESVHLCQYPQPEPALLKPELNRRMALAERVVRMGRRLREESDLRVRQPLAELRYACRSEQDAADLAAQQEVIADELNVKAFSRAASLDDLVHYSYKPNLKTLGPKYGKLLNALRQQIPALGDAVLAPLRSGQFVELTIDGNAVTLAPDDVLVSTEQASDWRCAEEAGIQIALSTVLTPELIGEGIARDFVRQVQQLRKDADLEITDRIRVYYATDDETVAAAIESWREYIARETLADSIERRDTPARGARQVSVGDGQVWIWIERV